MKYIQRCIQLVATTIVAKEWKQLYPRLIQEYHRYEIDTEARPPLIAQKLLISGEDHRFFSHPGFDLIAICRAVYRWVFLGLVEGASTIEQQLVRVLSGRYERTLTRKCNEILLATLITTVIPKHVLPSIYLNVGYFGWRMNNFGQACVRLRLTPHSMSYYEAANLVARLKYPEPRMASPERRTQIERRAHHLLNLYSLHVSTSVYKCPAWRLSYASI